MEGFQIKKKRGLPLIGEYRRIGLNNIPKYPKEITPDINRSNRLSGDIRLKFIV